MIEFLLDVNVLLALADPLHVHHEAAHSWFASRGRKAWATCPMTENAFVRIASHPSYPNRPGDAPAVLELLRRMCSSEGHRFWPDTVSLRDVLGPGIAITQGQVTDVFLLCLAIANGGRLATLDRHVPAGALPGGTDALEVIPVG
jgi:uncharacterized protein